MPRRIVFALVLLTGLACQSVVRAALASPIVALRDVRIAGIGVTGGTFDVLLSVYNPNEFDLDASSITYSVIVDTTVVGAGESGQRVVVPARDSALVRLPVRFDWNALGNAGRTILNAGTLDYRVKGAMRISSGVGTITIPYDQRGRYSTTGAR